MYKIIGVLMLLIICGSCFAVTGKDIKGVYVTGWTKGMFTKGEIDETLKAARDMGAEDIFLQVRKYDDAYYNSELVKKPDSIAPNFDPLGYALAKGHSMGLRIHAWLVICRLEGPNYATALSAEKQGWLAKQANGTIMSENAVYIDPSYPQAREYLASVVKDLLKNYKVDGIHWDYIRYAKSTYSYSTHSRLAFFKEYGIANVKSTKYDDFRREQMNGLVKTLHDAVRSENKTIPISAATITWGSIKGFENTRTYWDCFQDYPTWLRNGWIDIAMPMLYKRESVAGQKQDYRDWLAAYAGQGTPEQFAITVSATMNKPDEVVTQIKTAKAAGYGWCIFAFNQNEDRDPVRRTVKAAGL